MMREYHVRICERLGVKFPGPTRQNEPCHSLGGHGRSTSVSVPAGPAVGTSEVGQIPTHARQQNASKSDRTILRNKAAQQALDALRSLALNRHIIPSSVSEGRTSQTA